MTIPEEVAEDETAYMEITKPNGDKETVEIAELDKVDYQGGQYYKIAGDMGVPAKEMTEDIVSKFYYQGAVVFENYFKVKDYADYVLANSTSQNLKKLTSAMVHYGAYAQLYFKHNTDNLANEGHGDYSESLKAVTADTLRTYAQSSFANNELVKLHSVSLLLKSETVMRMFFKIKDGIDPATVTFNGKAANGVRNGLYYVDITNIAAKDLDTEVEVKICVNGAEIGTASYSPMRYCYNVLCADADADLVKLAKALYLYHKAAVGYFG